MPERKMIMDTAASTYLFFMIVIQLSGIIGVIFFIASIADRLRNDLNKIIRELIDINMKVRYIHDQVKEMEDVDDEAD
jgi:hypothetical protein